MTLLSQRDTRWKDIKIGKSTSSIGNYGCTLTCLAMLAGTTPDVVNAELTKVGGFLIDRIIWQKINETNLPLEFPYMGRAYSYDNTRVLEAINKNGGCLVEVDFDGITATPNDRHWVLYIGNQRCIDPWTGNEVSTSKYPLRKGFCVINVKEDNMTDEQKRILQFLQEQNVTEGDVRAGIGYVKDKTVERLETDVKSLKTQVNDLIKRVSEQDLQIKDLTSKLEEEVKNGELWQTEIKTANNKIIKLEKQIETKEQEVIEIRKEALDKSADKLTFGELLQLLIKKLFK